MNTDWIKAHTGEAHGPQDDMAYAMECTRCGDIQKVTTPIAIDCYLAMAKAFIKLHRGCKDRGENDRE